MRTRTYKIRDTRPNSDSEGESMSARAYPGRDKARILRRAASLQRHHAAESNQRAQCCRKPEHVEVPDAAIFTTQCRNCGAVV